MLHANNLKSFENYRTLIKDSRLLDNKHPVLDLIVQEHVFTKDIRNKIKASYKLFPKSPQGYEKDSQGNLVRKTPSSKVREPDELEGFLLSLNEYIQRTCIA